MTRPRWQDRASLTLGLYLLVLPLFTSDSPNRSTVWSAEIFGTVVVLVSLWALAVPSAQAAEGTQLLVSLLLIVAPLMFDYTAQEAAAVNAFVVGSALLVLSVSATIDLGRAIDPSETPRGARHR